MLTVISAWKEPLPGYTEGLQGLNGWSMAGGRGVLRSMHCNGKQPSNVIQNDIVVNGIIILAYECAKQHQHRYEFGFQIKTQSIEMSFFLFFFLDWKRLVNIQCQKILNQMNQFILIYLTINHQVGIPI